MAISMKKRSTLRTALLISFASLVALGAAGGGVFAWFAMQNTASVNLSNIAVMGESTTAALKYCTLNYRVDTDQNKHYLGYKSNDSRIDSQETYNYDDVFLDADNAARTALKYAPGYSFTFAIEIQGSSNAQVIMSKYISKASTTYFYKDNGVKKGFALARALDVYTQVYSSKPTSSDLYNYFSHQGVIGNDYFNFVEATSEAGTAINQPCSAGFNASSTAYFLLTMYFSDDPSTWYSVATDNVDKDLEGVGNGSTKVFALPNGTNFVNSVTLTDRFTGDGDRLVWTLSNSPYEINSVKIKTAGSSEAIKVNNYTLNDNVLTFSTAPADGSQIEVDYVATPSSFSFTSDSITFKNALNNGTTIKINCKSELDYYVADPVNGNSNVYEGLTIALTDLLIS